MAAADATALWAEEIMLRFACKKGIAGIVVDGCLRDLDGKTSLFSAAIASSITDAHPCDQWICENKTHI